MKLTTIITTVLGPMLVTHAFAQSNIAPERKWAWSENCGWTNWQHDAPKPGDGVFVTQTHLAGFVWCENIGWINLGDGNGPYPNDMQDSSTFGVNLDSTIREIPDESDQVQLLGRILHEPAKSYPLNQPFHMEFHGLHREVLSTAADFRNRRTAGSITITHRLFSPFCGDDRSNRGREPRGPGYDSWEPQVKH